MPVVLVGSVWVVEDISSLSVERDMDEHKSHGPLSSGTVRQGVSSSERLDGRLLGILRLRSLRNCDLR